MSGNYEEARGLYLSGLNGEPAKVAQWKIDMRKDFDELHKRYRSSQAIAQIDKELLQ